MFSFDLKPKEKLLKLSRQAEIVLARPALIVMASIYLPAAFLIKYDLFFQYKGYMFLWSGLLLIYFANKYALWLLNSNIITSQRVVVVQYHSVFSKEVTEAPLNHITNVKYSSRGILQSLLGLGNVEIKVSGLEHPLVLKHQSHPDKLKDFLWNLQNGADMQAKI